MTGCAVTVTALLAATSVAPAEEVADPLLPNHAQARARVHRHTPLRVYVSPSRWYRECLDHPVVEHRPGGDTVVPWFTCRWAAR
jgi:hypothetical protein